MSTCAGVHIGNTNSVITVYKDGKVQTVSNETGDRVTPAIVAYTGAEKVIGQPAKQYMIRNPTSCITNIMSAIGQSFSEEHVKQIKTWCPCELVNEKGSVEYKVLVKGDEEEETEDKDLLVSPVKAASYIFTKLLEIGESIGGDDLEDLVITVPKSFSEEQKIALYEAAESIGCNVLRLISAPAAATLAYGICQEEPTTVCNVLVFRLGGTSMTVSIVDVNSGMIRVQAEKTINDFGSKNFDKVLLEHACEDFKRKHRLSLKDSKRSITKLLASLENCKVALSSSQTNQCVMDALYEGIDYTLKINRAKFESLCSAEFKRCIALIDQVLTENGMDDGSIDKVILVGGGTNTPKLQQLVRDRFPKSEVLSSIPPAEVLAEGAARQAAILLGREDTMLDVVTLACLPKNIGFQTVSEDGSPQLQTVIEKFTPVPTRRSQTFQVDPAQSSLMLNLFESSDATLGGGKRIAQVGLKDLGVAAKDREIQADFEITKNGSLLVSVTDKASNRTETVSIDIQAA